MFFFFDKYVFSDVMIYQKFNYFIFLYIKYFVEVIIKFLVKYFLYVFSDISILIFIFYMYLFRYIVFGVLEEKRSGFIV